MKKIIRISLITLASLFLFAIILPFAFKGKIVALVKDTMNENLHATVDFAGAKLSLFRHFPNLSLRILDLSVINHTPFEGDTLASIPSLTLTIDLFNLFKGAPYEVRRIELKSPDIRVKVLLDGQANWDIVKGSEEPVTTDREVSDEGFTLRLKKMTVSGGYLTYDDRSLPVYVHATGLSLGLSGDLSAEKSSLSTRTMAEELSVRYDGVTYLSRSKARVNAEIMANLNDYHFEFTDGEIFINALRILASGWFAMPEEGYRMNIDFKAPGTDFREALSLIPAVYAKDFERVETSGTFSLSGNIEGLYSESSMPGFSLNLAIRDAMFQYPDLPSRVEDIQMACNIVNPDGIPDHTVIDISQFHIVMAGSPIDASLHLRTPVSDPNLRAALKGKLDLGNVGSFYPLDGTELKGQAEADVKIEGRMSYLDQKAYEKFKATGLFTVSNLTYGMAHTPEMKIPSLRLRFSPASMSLEEFRFSSGASSFSAKGEVTQYLGWILRDETLHGSLNLISPKLDLNELLGEEEPEAEIKSMDEGSMALTAPDIPENIDFSINTQVSEMIFGDMSFEGLRGQVVLRDGRININDIYMKALDGEIRASGHYAKTTEVNPSISMNLAFNGIDIRKAYESSGLMRKLAPVARHTRGKVTTSLSLSGELDNALNPVYASLAGKGNFSTSTINVSGLPTLQKIADLVSINELREAVLQPVQASFIFTDGKVEVKPFTIKVKDLSADISGTTGFDQSLAYVMKMKVPRDAMGNKADALVADWVSQAASKGVKIDPGSTLQLDVLIGGTITQPEIRTGLSGMAESMKEELKQAVIEKVEEIKTEVRQEISKKAEDIIREAEKQAAAIMAQAQKQAEAVKSTASEAAKKIRQEADTQANRIIAEGKAKGPIAAAIAEKAANKTREEAYEKADALEREASKKAEAMLTEAKRQSDQTIEEGRKKAQTI